VLYSAISANVDILITGDKDIAEVVIKKPVILTQRNSCKNINGIALSRIKKLPEIKRQFFDSL
jgi:hypothetical protein